MKETKREKFIRLAESRMNNVLKQIQLLGNLSNTNVYEYMEEDVDKMMKALRSAIVDLEQLYKKDKKSKRFSL